MNPPTKTNVSASIVSISFWLTKGNHCKGGNIKETFICTREHNNAKLHNIKRTHIRIETQCHWKKNLVCAKQMIGECIACITLNAITVSDA